MGSLVTVVVTIGIILFILFVPYLLFDWESIRLDESTRTALPGTVFHAIDNCGHIANFEKPEIVNPILVDFLMGHQSRR